MRVAENSGQDVGNGGRLLMQDIRQMFHSNIFQENEFSFFCEAVIWSVDFLIRKMCYACLNTSFIQVNRLSKKIGASHKLPTHLQSKQ